MNAMRRALQRSAAFAGRDVGARPRPAVGAADQLSAAPDSFSQKGTIVSTRFSGQQGKLPHASACVVDCTSRLGRVVKVGLVLMHGMVLRFTAYGCT